MAGARQAARLGALLEAESDQLDNSAAVLRDLRCRDARPGAYAGGRISGVRPRAKVPGPVGNKRKAAPVLAICLPPASLLERGHWRLAAQVERPIRIVLADDHPVVRIGVRNMLTEQDGFEVVGEADDGDEAITQTLELQPDILLLDVQMPRLPGLEAMRAIMNGSPTVKILLLTSTITTQQIIEALHIGARGIVLKDALASHLQDRHPHRLRRRLLDRRQARGQPGLGSPRPDAAGRRAAAQDLRPHPARARSGGLHRGRVQQPRHRQAVQPERRDRQAPPVEHLRQDRRLHAPGTGAVRHCAPSW